MAEAVEEVVVGEPGRLHQRVAGRAPDETEAVLRQEPRQRVRLRGACGDPLAGRVARLSRQAVDDRPDERAKRAPGAVQCHERPRIGDDALDLAAVAYDRRVRDQAVDAAGIEPRDARRVEPGERLAVAVALREDRAPRETGLRAFERQEFEQRILVGRGHAPFAIVVVAFGRAPFAPGAA